MLAYLTTCKGLRPLGSYGVPWQKQVGVVVWPPTLPYNAMRSRALTDLWDLSSPCTE